MKSAHYDRLWETRHISMAIAHFIEGLTSYQPLMLLTAKHLEGDKTALAAGSWCPWMCISVEKWAGFGPDAHYNIVALNPR